MTTSVCIYWDDGIWHGGLNAYEKTIGLFVNLAKEKIHESEVGMT